MAFRWRVDDGPLIAVFEFYLTLQQFKKKTLSMLDPLWQNRLDPRMKSDLIAKQFKVCTGSSFINVFNLELPWVFSSVLKILKVCAILAC